METGLWPLEYHLWYKKLMLYHNIVNGKESRLARLIWLQQYKYDMPNSFHSNVKKLCSILDLSSDPETMRQTLKSNWKDVVKTRV